MSKRSYADKDGINRSDPAWDLEQFLRTWSSNLYSVMVKYPMDFRFLKILQRDSGDWLSVLGLYDEDGTPTVAFGAGYTLGTALTALRASVSSGKLRPDTYATPRATNQQNPLFGDEEGGESVE